MRETSLCARVRACEWRTRATERVWAPQRGTPWARRSAPACVRACVCARVRSCVPACVFFKHMSSPQAGDVPYATMFVSLGSKPSMSGSADVMLKGNLTLQVDYSVPKPGVYQISVSFFPEVYFGVALRHLYDIFCEVGAISTQQLQTSRDSDARSVATTPLPPLCVAPLPHPARASTL